MQLIAGLQLIRWGNCLLAVASVLVGAYLTIGDLQAGALLVTCVVVFTICAGGNVVNDVVDIQIDKVNHPARPLPSGKVSRQAAIRLAVALHISSGIAIAFAGQIVAIMGVAAAVLLLCYNFFFKRIPLVGNLTVALLGGATFVVGGVAVSEASSCALPGPLIPAAFAVLLHLAREIVKDVEDATGDRSDKMKTLPLWLGRRAALAIASGLYLLLTIVSLIPFFEEWYGIVYLLIVIVGMHIPVSVLLTAALMHPSSAKISRAKKGLKVAMVVGIIALLLG